MAVDLIERLRFDAARCELQFSRGVAGNIEEAAAEIVRLRVALQELAAKPIQDARERYTLRDLYPEAFKIIDEQKVGET